MDVLTNYSDFDYVKAKRWTASMETFVLQLNCLYVIVIFAIKYIMRDRKPFDLQLPLNIWNGLLSIFSIMGFLMVTPIFFSEIFSKGLTSSYCTVNQSFTSKTAGYWTFLWVVSKVPELVDTIFIVLRKRPLLFMHWFHHFFTGYFSFVSYPAGNSWMIWIVWPNYVVHSFMYSYYFLRSLRIRVPPQVARMITAGQIIQFLCTHTVMAHLAYLTWIQGKNCDVTVRSFVFGAIMEIIYLFLFSRFYYVSYIANGGKKFSAHKMSLQQEAIKIE